MYKKISALLIIVVLLLSVCAACNRGKILEIVVEKQQAEFNADEIFSSDSLNVVALYEKGSQKKLSKKAYKVNSDEFIKGVASSYKIVVSLNDNPDIFTTYDVVVKSPEFKDYSAGIKILSIGNSFSQDTTKYLPNVLKELGVQNIIIKHLYIGGCNLKMHWDNAENNKSNYTLTYTENNIWKQEYRLVAIESVLKSDEWDYITIQQSSTNSGLPETYNQDLTNLVNYIEKLKNPQAKIVWNMTWAYQQGSNQSGFANYDNDQMTMYKAIASTVKAKVLPNKDIKHAIPVGTALQNIRQTVIGDYDTRDSFHLNSFGQYVAALVWAKSLTGLNIDNLSLQSALKITNMTEQELFIIKKSVNMAFVSPYEITDLE